MAVTEPTKVTSDLFCPSQRVVQDITSEELQEDDTKKDPKDRENQRVGPA
jgi:hypothetical protein